MVVPLQQTILGMTSDLAPSAFQLTHGLTSAFSVVKRIHGCWRMVRRIKTYSQPSNFPYLAAGHLTQFFAQDCASIRIAAQLILIARNLQKCANRQIALIICYREWLRSLKGKTDLREKKVRYQQQPWISTIGRSLEFIAWRVLMVFRESLRLIYHLFLFSMVIIDTAHAFMMTPESREEGVQELYTNLRDVVSSHLKPLNVLFARLNVPHTVAQWVENLTPQEELAQPAHVIEKNNTPVKNVVGELGKRVLWGCAVICGLAHVVPMDRIPQPGKIKRILKDSSQHSQRYIDKRRVIYIVNQRS